MRILLLIFLSITAKAQVATNVAIYPSPSGPYFYAQWYQIQPGHLYELQFSGDLTHWYVQEQVTNSCATNAAWVQNTPLINHPKCFFRMREVAQ